MPRIHRLLLAPALLFSALLLAALLLTALLSFTDASTGVVEVRFVGAANYIQTLRSYLFRNALLNTGVVYLGAMAMAALLAALSLPPLTRRWRGRIVFACLLCLPLLMPATLGTLAWRQLFFPLGIQSQSATALAALAVVYAWRLWPVSAFLLVAIAPPARHWAWWLAGVVGAFWVLTDAASVLVLVGGAPFQTIHLWSSWLFQTAYAAGMVGESAAAAMLMLPALGIPGLLLAWALHGTEPSLTQRRKDAKERKEKQSPLPKLGGGRVGLVWPSISAPLRLDRKKMTIGWAVVALTLGVLVALPLLGQVAALRLDALRDLMQTVFPFWVFNTALLAVVIWLLGSSGAALTTFVRKHSAAAGQRWALACLVAGLMALPVAYIALIWLAPDDAGRTWLAAIPLAGGLILLMPWLADRSGDRSTNLWRFTALAALLLAIHAFTYPTVLKPTPSQQTVSVGVIQNLWRDLERAPALAAWAITLSTTLVILTVVAISWVGRLPSEEALPNNEGDAGASASPSYES